MITRPDQMPAAFAAAFNARDVQALLSLYGPEATMVPDGSTSVRGAAIGDALNGYLALQGPINMKLERAVVEGDTALVVASWTLDGKGPHGPLQLKGTTADVLRRSADGGWTYLIDAPLGLKA